MFTLLILFTIKACARINSFFSNIVNNLKIYEFKNLHSNIKDIKDPAFRAVLKYKNHPSIIAMKVNNEKIDKEIRRLNKNKASQKFDIPIRIRQHRYFC